MGLRLGSEMTLLVYSKPSDSAKQATADAPEPENDENLLINI